MTEDDIMSQRNQLPQQSFSFQAGLDVSKQSDSYADTFPSHTAPPDEPCDTGP